MSEFSSASELFVSSLSAQRKRVMEDIDLAVRSGALFTTTRKIHKQLITELLGVGFSVSTNSLNELRISWEVDEDAIN